MMAPSVWNIQLYNINSSITISLILTFTLFSCLLGSSREVVHQAGAPLGVAVDGTKRCLVDDGGGSSGTGDLVEDVPRHLRIRQPGEVVMYGNPLEQGLMDGLLQGVIKVGLPAEDEREAVEGVIPVVHEHLQVLQDAGGEVLCLIDCQEEGLLLVLVKVEDLLLYGAEHAGLAAPWL